MSEKKSKKSKAWKMSRGGYNNLDLPWPDIEDSLNSKENNSVYLDFSTSTVTEKPTYYYQI